MIKEQWARKAFLGEDVHHDAVSNAGALGSVEQLDRILNLTFQDLEDLSEEGEDGE